MALSCDRSTEPFTYKDVTFYMNFQRATCDVGLWHPSSPSLPLHQRTMQAVLHAWSMVLCKQQARASRARDLIDHPFIFILYLEEALRCWALVGLSDVWKKWMQKTTKWDDFLVAIHRAFAPWWSRSCGQAAVPTLRHRLATTYIMQPYTAVAHAFMHKTLVNSAKAECR